MSATNLNKIIWLASYPKSGNTWLRLFLENYVKGGDKPVDISQRSFFTQSDSWARDYAKLAGKPAAELTEADIQRLRPQVQRSYAEQADGAIFIKTHNIFFIENGPRLIEPHYTRNIIYMVRNPLDILDSLSDHMGFESLDEGIAFMGNHRAGITSFSHEHADNQQVAQYLQSWSDHVNAWTNIPKPHRLVVRYEDMKQQPYQTFKSILDYLGIAHTKAKIEKALAFSSFKELNKQERKKGFNEALPSSNSQKFFRRGVAGAWRQILTQAQVDQMVAHHGAVMKRFGYIV